LEVDSSRPSARDPELAEALTLCSYGGLSCDGTTRRSIRMCQALATGVFGAAACYHGKLWFVQWALQACRENSPGEARRARRVLSGIVTLAANPHCGSLWRKPKTPRAKGR
jgi:hypothetical protein